MINDQRTGNFVEEGAPEQSIQGRAVLGRRGVEKVFQVGRSKQSGDTSWSVRTGSSLT